MGMLIWLLALVLIASLAGLGYRQGAIRVAFSFVAILVGTLLAPPLGRLLKPLFTAVGVTNPVLAWMLGPVVVFVLISIAFKVGALQVHQKVDVRFKYYAGDLRLLLWERLSRRVGLCLGVLNGVSYFIIIAFGIFVLSYWTFQLATPGQDPTTMRLLNQLGEDLQNCGFSKVARAVDHFPPQWFEAADLAGLIYNNPLTEARLARYPAFLGLAELSDFKLLGNDKEFADLRQKQAPLMDVIHYPRIDGILKNPDLLRQIWGIVAPDMKDLRTFLATGQSPTYDSEKILGRWNFNVNLVVNAVRRSRPNMSGKELGALRHLVTVNYAKAIVVAMTDHRVLLKNMPELRAGGGTSQNIEGKWDGAGGKYTMAVASGGDFSANVVGDRLTINTGDPMNLIFDREE